jgi:hypothetical protein
MSLLPDGLELQLIEQETKRNDMPAAKRVLEAAIIFQFRALADGLLADLLLRNQVINNLEWWFQYLSKVDTRSQYLPDLQDSDFIAFRKQFSQSIFLRQTRRVTVADLGSARIRFFGGHTDFWQDGRINRQLANLGSSLRLIVTGSHSQRENRIRSLLGQRPVDISGTRFILGQIGPISAVPRAALFDFENEFALSPYVPGMVSGLTDQARIVVRQIPIRVEVEETIRSGEIVPSAYEERLRELRRAVIGHEARHVLFDARRMSNGLSLVNSWLNAIREDICRFTQTPRLLDEVREAFAEVFDPPNDWDAPFINAPLNHGCTLEGEVQRMLAERILLVGSDGKLLCPLYQEGRPWTLI